MKHFLILISLIISWIPSTSHPVFIKIDAKLISCQSYNYNIIVHTIYPNDSDIIFGGIEVNLGDGTVEEYTLGDMTPSNISKDMTLYQYKTDHAFPGPGTYKLSARIFNRSANILNMENSVNTPLYVETADDRRAAR